MRLFASAIKTTAMLSIVLGSCLTYPSTLFADGPSTSEFEWDSASQEIVLLSALVAIETLYGSTSDEEHPDEWLFQMELRQPPPLIIPFVPFGGAPPVPGPD